MPGSIRKRAKGSWTVIVDLGRDPVTGKRRQVWRTVRGTKRDAEALLARLLHERNTGTDLRPERLTVGQYLERWLADYAAVNVSPKTFERYAEIVRVHLIPALGSIPLQKLRPLHIQRYYADALRRGRRDGLGGLSAQTVLHHHRVLSAALRQAVRWQLLPTNPAEAVEAPRPRRQDVRVVGPDGLARLLEEAERSEIYLPVVLAIAGGLRRGEIAALRWSDVDLETGRVSVSRSLEVTREGLRFKEPKSGRGRTVTLPAAAVAVLRQHRAQQAEERLLMGDGYEDWGLVWAQHDGRPHHPDKMTRGIGPVARRAGLPGLRFHDLRHSHATLLLAQGVHPKLVAERLGHSTITITLDRYSHVLPSMQEEVARRLDALLPPLGAALP